MNHKNSMGLDKSKRDKGAIAGRVSTTEDKSVTDASLMITGNSPDHPDIAVLTNDNGEYIIDDLTPGDYEVLVNAEGHAMKTLSARVVDSQITKLNFLLDD
jgi:hypothetical protein